MNPLFPARTATILAASSIGAVMLLSACGSSSSSSASTSPDASAVAAACPLAVSDQWVKAADSGMTAAFGVVSNPTGEPVTITGASTSAATSTELHETVDKDGTSTMQQVQSFQVPANETLELQPGGNHIMLIGLPAAIEPGQEVAITLSCGDQGTTEFTAQARSYAGANETYTPNGEASESTESGMNMS